MRIIGITLIVLLLATGVAAQPRTDWKALAVQYKQVLARYPTDAHTRYNLAMVYAHEGQVLDGWRELQNVEKVVGPKRPEFTAQVISESQRILKRTPNDILTRYRLAFALYFQGQKDQTRQEFERIVTLEPNHSWSLAYLGYTYAEAGKLDKAIDIWERGVKVDPTNSVLHYVLGLAYTRKGQLKKAAGHFAAAYKDRTLYEYVKSQEKK